MDEIREYIRSLEPQFKTYCMKIRGFATRPCGTMAVILWLDFERDVISKAQERIENEVICNGLLNRLNRDVDYFRRDIKLDAVSKLT